MTQSHTPGPWAYVKPNGISIRHPIVYSDSGPIGHASWLGNDRRQEVEANARMMAASPDLLEALQGLMYKDCGEPAFVTARAAILKATGEQK